MKIQIAEPYQYLEEDLMEVINNFDRSGKMLFKGSRNSIRKVKIQGQRLTIKSFQLPNLINKFVYRFIRKSKAQRSFEYGQELINNGFLTPKPVAWIEERRLFTLGRSYYISKRLRKHITFRELINNPDLENWEEILIAFTEFTHQLHKANIFFLDHSPGNTLIKKGKKGGWKFYLVDLNRMKFKQLSNQEKINNFSTLSATSKMLEIMATEYAKLEGWPIEETIEKFNKADQKFKERKNSKKKLKKLLFKKG